ncbi:hypothetical protein MCQ_00363 [Candidatus Bartonella washoeensis Sb944nv]|uniref:Uncharacterized protein n=2 Tax=Candidatus Bartonella washoeensis TaxID=186739 RepID=J0QRE6_9HYPH|nr:hypothetical protein MCQ_00363 [Bartonella washoeensis Sb944nv]EJF85634.1 hypothetical protein MCW_00621 [Bartonella washoeensis 085-0475]
MILSLPLLFDQYMYVEFEMKDTGKFFHIVFWFLKLKEYVSIFIYPWRNYCDETL